MQIRVRFQSNYHQHEHLHLTFNNGKLNLFGGLLFVKSIDLECF